MPMGPDGAFLDAVSVDRGSAILLHRQIYDGLRKLVYTPLLEIGLAGKFGERVSRSDWRVRVHP